MIIKFSNYTDGIHYFDFKKPVKSIGLNDPFFGDVILNVKMDKSHGQIVVNCSMFVQAKWECDRCNELYICDLHSDFRIAYLFDKQPGSDEKLNLYYISPEEDKIDLTTDVVDYTMLSVPMKKLCNEDCKGLCAKCGINLNQGKCRCRVEKVNDIWLPLQKLKKNIDK